MNRFSDFFLLFLLPSLIFTQITPTTAPIVSILNYKLNAVTNSQYSDVTLAGSLVSAGPTETVYNVYCTVPPPGVLPHCVINNFTQTVTQGPSTFHYTRTGKDLYESVGCSLQSTTAASCLYYSSGAASSTSVDSNPATTTQTRLLCASPDLNFLPMHVEAGVPNASTLSTGPFPTATETPWCVTTTGNAIPSSTNSQSMTGSSAAPRSTSSQGIAGTGCAPLGWMWEAIVGGIVGVAVLL